jgi:glycosyltransferase involved in cell wall biosynthesis
MRVLSLSLDPTIAPGATGDHRGDAAARQREYAARLERYAVLTKAPRGAPTVRQSAPAPGFTITAIGGSRLLFLPRMLREGLRLTAAERFDLVTAQDAWLTGVVAYVLARRRGLRLNLQLHSDILDNPHWRAEKPLHHLYHPLAKWLLRRADSVRVGTSRERRKVIALGLPPERVYLLPVAVDLRPFAEADGAALRARLLGNRYDRLVLAVGRLVPAKDLDTLLHAAPLVRRHRPGARFVIVGAGPLRPRLEALAARLGLGEAVHFAGAVPHEQIAAYFAACDVFALSSLYEGTSLAMVEALAAGKPVVCTDVAGAEDWLGPGCGGFVVPQRDPVALAERICYLLSNPAEAAALGAAGQERVLARFDRQQLLDGVIKMWRETVKHDTRVYASVADHPEG